MGRELKRVSVDFDWPLHQRWPGYCFSICTILDDDCDGLCKKFAEYTKTQLSVGGCPLLDIDPPQGDGYQIWETVSEGSPVSPVFENPEDLATWMVNNDKSITQGTTFDGWMKFITGPGWAPSMVYDPVYGLRSGVEALTDE